jgi:ferric-dicitrate binding protein FerR (iron transport regulator)
MTKSKGKRAARRAQRARARRRRRLLAGAAAVVGLLALVGLALQLRTGARSDPDGAASLDKSKGDPAAPVVVVEYGDFQ